MTDQRHSDRNGANGFVLLGTLNTIGNTVSADGLSLWSMVQATPPELTAIHGEEPLTNKDY